MAPKAVLPNRPLSDVDFSPRSLCKTRNDESLREIHAKNGAFDWMRGAQSDYRRSDADEDSIGNNWRSTGTNCKNPASEYRY
ncbi:hypothetical protein QR680_003380 [Steinernema hermaphroditum]|uniref:Uncharacterized protein n=1 Tax=Steinernema hermaphroditum TaxID=289476 RepID=A0AA39LJL9_9BILA|nr:hypothetical protein QR680_003380 [Steinernema hermaphroditum]